MKLCPNGHVCTDMDNLCPKCGYSFIEVKESINESYTDVSSTIVLYEDSNYEMHSIDSNGEIRRPQWGCLYWENGHLYKNNAGVILDLGRISEPDEPSSYNIYFFCDMLIVDLGNEETPCSIYTKEGKEYKSSGKYIIIKHWFGEGCPIAICKSKNDGYYVVDILQDELVIKLDDRYLDQNKCSRISFCSNSFFFVTHTYEYDYLEYLNIRNGKRGIIHSFTCPVTNGHKYTYIEAINDSQVLFSIGNGYKPGDPKYVFNINGNVDYTFYNDKPKICHNLLYSLKEGMYDCQSGIFTAGCTPLLSINDYLYTFSTKLLEHKFANRKTNKLLEEGKVYPVLSTESKIKDIVIYHDFKCFLLDFNHPEEDITNLPFSNGYTSTKFFTENGLFKNFFESEYDPSLPGDMFSNNSKSVVLDTRNRIIAEDTHGEYISLCGMPDGIVYFLKANGEFGELQWRNEKIIRKIVIPDDTYAMQPLYNDNQFLIWGRHRILLINASGNVLFTIDFNYEGSGLNTDMLDIILEIQRMSVSFSSVSIVYQEENQRIICCNFKNGKISEINDFNNENCAIIPTTTEKRWANLITYFSFDPASGCNIISPVDIIF